MELTQFEAQEIKADLIHLLLTRKGTRYYLPDFGTRLYEFLFEPFDGLTFDAIEDLNITGEVGEIDAIGTVSQGVVTYNVKIVFDTQDDRVKPGMSVSAVVITDARQDVLLVSNSAVKSTNGTSYVEVVDALSLPKETSLTGTAGVILKNPPRQQQVTVGLSNDTDTEITEGLKEGDLVVSRTVSSSSVNSTQTQQGTSNNRTGGTGGMMMFR